MCNKRKLLLTGASGFVGRNVRPLLEEYFSIVSLGRTSGNDVVADLSVEAPALKGSCDVVFHAAGLAHISPDEVGEKAFFKVNVDGTRNLCKALEATGIPSDFIYISSVAVYGADTGRGITEKHPLEGRTPYARSKIEAERFLAGWCRDYGVTLTVLRPPLLVGADAPGNFGSMVRGIRHGYYFDIAGGTALRSILAVSDLAPAAMCALGRGGIYNVASQESPSVGQISCAVASAVGRRKPFNLSMRSARMLARIGDVLGKRSPFNTLRLSKLISDLTFSSELITERLDFRASNLFEAIAKLR